MSIENNEIESPEPFVTGTLNDGTEIYAARAISCYSMDQYEDTLKVAAISANTLAPIVLCGGETEINAFCTYPNKNAVCIITFEASEGGNVERWTDDGALFIEPVPDEGYVFDGYYVDGERVDVERFDFDKTTTVELRFALEG